MKKYLIVALVLAVPFVASAASILEGRWTQDGSKITQVNEFNGSVTLNTTAYYATGEAVNWFFNFPLPKGRDVKPGEVIQGRVRSVDGYYSCVFDEKAEAMLEKDGRLKIHFPTLTFYYETREVRDRRGYYRGRQVDWTYWGWVESIYYFPIEEWRTISSKCVVSQRNWLTHVLSRTNSPF